MRPLAHVLQILIAGLALLAAPALSRAQEPAAPEALRVFIDCLTYFCDHDFFRKEISFVNHVRNRQDAQVHLLLTTQRTGGGGTEFTVSFLGREQFAARHDTLRYVAEQTATQDEIRTGLARIFKAGLVRYVAESPVLSHLRITYDAGDGQAQAVTQPAQDPWNYWVFRITTRGFFSGEKSQRFANFGGSLSANRITDDWKLTTSLNGNFDESRFDTGTRIVRTDQRSYSGSGLLVRSLGGHWSTGFRVSASSSTFLNQRLAVRIAPAVEYDLFPYSESTRRQLRFLYATGANSIEYREETIFLKSSEALLDHSLTTALDLRQPWGSINFSLEGAQYLHDLSKYRVMLNGGFDIRLVKGLSLNLFGSTAWLRDQLYLARRGATEEEILLRRRQLATSYRYFTSVGLSYSFGSIYSNVVNPRFGGSGGGVFIIN